MPFTAVSDRSTLQLSDLKDHLKIEQDFTDQDVELQRFLDEAKQDADNYLINPFTNTGYTTGTNIPIPAKVDLWVLRKAAREYEWRILGQNTESVPGVGTARLDHDPVRDYDPIAAYRDPAGNCGF